LSFRKNLNVTTKVELNQSSRILISLIGANEKW